jgi:glutaredoxin-like protein NrdH
MYEYEIQNGIPVLFALSTCPRCGRMKAFLQQNGVQAKIIDLDYLRGAEKRGVVRFLSGINPSVTVPTLMVGRQVVVGEDYDRVAEALQI